MKRPQLARIASLVKDPAKATKCELGLVWNDTNALICLLLRARERLGFEGNLNESLIEDISSMLGE